MLGGLPPGSVPTVRVTRYGSGHPVHAFLLTCPRGFASFDQSLGRRTGLARRVDLIRLKMQNGPIRLMRSGAIPRYEAY